MKSSDHKIMTETCKININNTKKLNELENLENKQRIIDKAPFDHLKIDDPSILDNVKGREICNKCFKSRKFFCYTCYTPVIDSKYFPRVKLPIKIDIIKHRKEIEGKSTAIHAAILAPEDVTIYIYPDFPIFTPNDKVVLIFPGKNAISIDDLLSKRLNKENQSDDTTEDDYYPITRAIFIDSTWQQTKSIYNDPRLCQLPCVVFSSRISQFWRHQKKSPRWYLATIEAVHTFLVELHTKTYGTIENYNIKQVNTEDDEKYSGQYDNLLYIFKYMYHKIHTIYDRDQLRAYKRPLI